MDNITHIVLGAALGEAVAGKRIGKRALFAGAIAGNIPDIDVFLATYQSVPDSLLSHRGFTHSILFCVPATFLFSWLFRRWKHSGSDDFVLWLKVFSLGLFSHILLDACTSYGTGWFEPFSHYRVSFNNIFVVDPFYTLPMLVSFIALLILKRNANKRKLWNAIGFGLSTAYLAYASFVKITINTTVEENLASNKISAQEYVTTPTPLNCFLWYIMVKDSTGFYLGYHSVFDKTEKIDFHFYPQNQAMLAPFLKDKGVDKLVRFSEGYYCLTADDSAQIDFHDLRFGQIGGWYNAQAPFIFSYHFGFAANNALVIQRGRISIVSREAISSLVARIKGI